MKPIIKANIILIINQVQRISPKLYLGTVKYLSSYNNYFAYRYLLLINRDESREIFDAEITSLVSEEMLGEFSKLLRKGPLTLSIAAAIEKSNKTEELKELIFKSLSSGQLIFYPYYLKLASKLSDPSLLYGLVNFMKVMEYKELNSTSNSYQLIETHSGSYSFSEPKTNSYLPTRERKSLKLKDEYIHKLKDIIISPGFCLVQNDMYLIADYSSHPQNEEVSGLYQYISSGVSSNKVLGTFSSEISMTVDKGILIAGRNSSNFFHWLIEYLPRLKTIDALKLDTDYKLIIPNNLPPQLLSALNCVNERFEVVEIDPITSIQVKELIVPSFHTYIPDRYDIPFWKSSLLSYDHLDFIKELILNKLNQSPSGRSFNKIYLSRRSNKARQITNKKSVEKVFTKFKYEIIYPEDFSFLEQVNIFRSAIHIAGPGGAAFTNLIFCKPATKVLGLVSEQNKKFCLHSNLANYAGCEFKYHVSPFNADAKSYSSLSTFFHSPYKVDLKTLIAELSNTH